MRWIDLGCPIDIDPEYDPLDSASRSYGWMGDDQRPTLALALPRPGINESLSRILIGATDAYTGIDPDSLVVLADFEINGVPPGTNVAKRFQQLPGNRWELKLTSPINGIKRAMLTVSVKDRKGNISRIERRFSIQ